IEGVEGALEVLAAAHRVTIQPADSCLGKHSVQQFLKLLGTGPEEVNVFAATMHAGFWHRRSVSTIMALHPLRALVVRHGDSAVLALQCLATTAAKSER